jgi:hypothetical protein
LFSQLGIRTPGTQIAQTALELSGGSQLPRRIVPVIFMENPHRYGASALVPSGSTIDGAYACHWL